MKKFYISFILCCFCTVLSATSVLGAYKPQYSNYANALNKMDLLSGSSGSGGYMLDKKLTRAETSVMIVRLLGKESEARSSFSSRKTSHPFTDVPAWADPFVAYLYSNNLVAGTSKTTYGSNQNITASNFLTMVLRAMGYSDTKGDFSNNDPFTLAKNINLLSTSKINEVKSTFYRDQAVLIMYNSLTAQMKDGTVLIKYLANTGAVTSAQINSTGITSLVTASGIGAATATEGLSVGLKPYDFNVTLINGNTVSLSSYKNKVVLLNFWATWCGPCVSEMPAIQSVRDSYGSEVIILAVNSMEDKKTVSDYIDKNSYTFGVGLDIDGAISAKYKLDAIPQTYIINKKGVISSKQTGAMSESAMVSAINKALDE